MNWEAESEKQSEIGLKVGPPTEQSSTRNFEIACLSLRKALIEMYPPSMLVRWPEIFADFVLDFGERILQAMKEL